MWGIVGYQYPYLSNAKLALYHLSFIPTILASQNFQFCIINNSENEEISLLNMSWIRKNWKEITYLIINSFILELRGINPLPCQSKHSTIWATSPRFLHHKTLNVSSSIIVKMKNYPCSLCCKYKIFEKK